MSDLRPQPNHLTRLPFEELGRLAESHDANDRRLAREAIHYLTFDACVAAAREACRRAFHRSERCTGAECDGAFIAALLEALDQVAGHDANGKTRARKGLIGRWLDCCSKATARGDESEDFLQYVTRWLWRGQYHANVLRVWRGVRGLCQRPRLSDDDMTILVDAYRWMLTATPAMSRVAADLGLDGADAVKRLVTALADDAAQTGLYEAIDAERIARHLKLDTDLLREHRGGFASLLYRFDDLIAVLLPVAYDAYLGRPRDLTRQVWVDELRVDFALHGPGEGDAQDGWTDIAA